MLNLINNNLTNNQGLYYKPPYFKRQLAFIIDIILVSIVRTLLFILILSNTVSDSIKNIIEILQSSISESPTEQKISLDFTELKSIIFSSDFFIPVTAGIIFVWLVGSLYYIICNYIYQYSIGKYLLGLRICRIDGTRPSLSQIITRYIFSLPPWIIQLYIIYSFIGLQNIKLGFLGVFFIIIWYESGILPKEKKTIYDIISKTRTYTTEQVSDILENKQF